jgi:hypothetical protein
MRVRGVGIFGLRDPRGCWTILRDGGGILLVRGAAPGRVWAERIRRDPDCLPEEKEVGEGESSMSSRVRDFRSFLSGEFGSWPFW